MAEDFDVVIVGGGIGGGALATVLARAGLSVLVLEKSTVYRDHVRGEWMAPWGVVELKRLELYGTVRAAGGHHLARHWTCDEDVPPDEALAMPLDLTALLPDVEGPLCIGHPRLCQLFIETAAEAGATVRRGVTDVRIAPGGSPPVAYRDDGAAHRATCRLIVGADGRGSQVRRDAGIALHRDPTHHLFAGMLVEGAHGWPEDTQVIGAENDVHYLAFPQGGGRVRLYLGYSSDQPRRLAGSGGPQAFLDAFRLRSVPGSEHLADAIPAGPCNSYPNEDTWTDRPYADGLVLVGDAAGSNDPIIGQGLSITMRDVRQVRDALLGSRDWSGELFREYAAERAERMRRLRFAAALISTMENEFGPVARERRRRARERQLQDPTLFHAFMAALIGPESIPAETFEPQMRERLFGAG
jgi:2-polyprenyl-6-methoxyphenol hydroxylase-like FAD-dependent oxidoreductase